MVEYFIDLAASAWHWGYLIVFVIVALECHALLGLFMPGESLVLMSGFPPILEDSGVEDWSFERDFVLVGPRAEPEQALFVNCMNYTRFGCSARSARFEFAGIPIMGMFAE